MRSLSAAVAFICLSLVSAQGSNFTCDRPADNLDKFIGLEWCLDSDPLPSFIFEPSPLNLFALAQANGGAPVIVDLGYGSYMYGDGTYMTNLYVYEKECSSDTKKSKKKSKKDKMTKDSNGGYRSLKGSTSNRRGLSRYGTNCERLGAVLVDAPPNLGPGFGDFIKTFLDSINADLEVMIVTHEHLDHMGNGNNVMAANPTLSRFVTGSRVAETIHAFQTIDYGNPRIREIMSPNPDYPRYEFTDVFEGEATYHFGNQTLYLKELDGHTPGNLLIWHDASKVLTNIDAPVFPKWSPFFELAIALNIPFAYKLFDEYRAFDFRYFTSGHTTHIGTPEDVQIGEEYMVDIADASYRAFTVVSQDPASSANFGNVLAAVNPGAPPNLGNSWLIFGEYLRQIALVCVDIVLDSTQNYSGRNWIETLAAVRPTIYSHCETLTDALRVELPGGL